jgi:hypothetical protein
MHAIFAVVKRWMVSSLRKYLFPPLVLMCCLVTAACAGLYVPGVSDIRLLGIEAANLKSEPAIVWHGSSARWDETLIKVTFTTKTDLMRFADDHGLTIGNDAAICPLGSGTEIWGFPDLFFGDLEMDSAGILAEQADRYRELAKQVPLGGDFTYHFYLPVRRIGYVNNIRYGKPPYAPYDLTTEPRDICFQVSGGNMYGHGFVSNTVVITKAEITAAGIK